MPEPTTYPPAPAVSRPRTAGWIAPLALVISLLAAGAAGWAAFKPAPANGPLPSAETAPSAEPAPAADTSTAGADPKGQICDAFSTVSAAVFRYTHANPTGDPGVALAAAQEAIAANARLAMSGGSTYLLRNLSANTPAELADNVRSFAGTLDTIAMRLLAGVPDDNPDLVNLLKAADESNKKISGLCK
jgi:hypothetical protein